MHLYHSRVHRPVHPHPIRPGAAPMTPSQPTPPPAPLAPRASFPTHAHHQSLHKQAVVARVRTSPAGQQIFRTGPRWAVSVLADTQEFWRVVAHERERQRAGGGRFPEDVVMREIKEEHDASVSLLPPALGRFWVIVPGEDWEKVDCVCVMASLNRHPTIHHNLTTFWRIYLFMHLWHAKRSRH